METLKFGIISLYYPLTELYETISLVERSGMDFIGIPDHLAVPYHEMRCFDPFSLLAVAARETKKVRLGTFLTDPHRRHPAVLAQTIATIDAISGGRFFLGIGAGEAMNTLPYGIPFDKIVSRMRETIQVTKMLWTNKIVNFDGTFHKLNKAYRSVAPVQKPHPPIWIAANAPRTRKITAELANAWIGTRLTPELYSRDLKEVRQLAEDFGRKQSDIEPIYFFRTAISEDLDEATKIMEQAKRTFLHSPRISEKLGYKVPTYDFGYMRWVVTPQSIKAFDDMAKQVPFEIVEQTSPFGTPDKCIDLLDSFVKAGARIFLTRLVGSKANRRRTFDLFVKKVIPYFKEQTI